MPKPIVSIVMGSDSDLAIMRDAKGVLDSHSVENELRILSAHRSPEEARRYAKSARARGIKVIIAGAGGAAHLAGVMASHTTLPVIGIPMETKELKGIDSLFSTVQMPSGVPVATVTIGKTGAKNAAILALEILSLSDKKITRHLEDFKKNLARAVIDKNKDL